MDILSNSLILGFQQVLHPINFLYCFGGVVMGTLIGVLPGIGPVATMSILFPLTLTASPLSSIIMLAGIYYGAMYGGSTTSILVNIPGEAASVVTCLDGHQMARRGRAGPALGICALGSFIGGTFSVIILMVLVIPLSKVALRFGPAEFVGFISMGLAMTIYLSGRSMLKGLAMCISGLILGCVGTDIVSGEIRFAYGFSLLYDGIEMAPMVMGLFGISEVLLNIGRLEQRSIFKTRVKNLLPNLQDWKHSALPIARGSILGFFLGLIPGGGTILASFISYTVEKRVSKRSEEFGRGAIEGVAGPETANNAAVAGAFVPLFALGIPSNVVMAILLASFMVHGVAPGPGFIVNNPALFWGIIASMYIGNAMLVILNLPLIGMWVQILRIPYRVLFPLILLFCVIGAYSINFLAFDVFVMVVFGLLGYVLRKYDYPLAPMVFAFVLGPMFELAFQQTAIISSHNLFFIVQRPVAFVTCCIGAFLLISGLFSHLWKLRKRIIESTMVEE
ncbi:MAG: tripartite tricarboxylate transporter permease [Deltaproteobacteria bacterium]|nr:tripartite tricarboxylate transporter permease [Deltaproteobacteria bacterium]